jgi:hypothetical protein
MPVEPMQQGPAGDPVWPTPVPPAAGAEVSPWRRMAFRLTPKRVALIAVGLLVFLAISFLLARFFQTENTERDADLALVQAETKGDMRAMLDDLTGCGANSTCAAAVRANAANPRLRRSGEVKILQLESNTAYALSDEKGETRLAWTVLGTLPVVQCVEVRRTGNFFSGLKVELLGISTPINNEADC